MGFETRAWRAFGCVAAVLALAGLTAAEASAAPQLVKEINKVPFTSSPSSPTKVGSWVFFVADDGEHGEELWKTDGTQGGTEMVKDIRVPEDEGPVICPCPPVVLDSNPSHLTNIDGTLYFSANDGDHGQELWKSDGTEAGTVMVKDIDPGGASSWPAGIVKASGTIFFRASDNTASGPELWKTNGTTAGTTKVLADVSVSAGATGVGAVLFFAGDGSAGTELWKTDGTEAGTEQVEDIKAGGSSSPHFLTNVNGTLYFAADDGVHGEELWRSDGTGVGTVLVEDIAPGGAGSDSDPSFLADFGGLLVFAAEDGAHGRELWKSSGTEAGTEMVADIDLSGGANPQNPFVYGGELYFSAQEGTYGRELWRSDGTEAGTELVADIDQGAAGSSPGGFTSFEGAFGFSAEDDSHGRELWKSDGTEAGTVLVKDIDAGQEDSHPAEMLEFDGLLLFTASDQAHGLELWRSDGTAAGTMVAADPSPGSEPSVPSELTTVGSAAYFAADDGVHGEELWKTDGTEAGTVLVEDINSPPPIGCPCPPTSSSPWGLLGAGGTLYFAANDGEHGRELWKTDGTAAGTVMVKDINFGSSSSQPWELTKAGNTVFFSANDGTDSKADLWKTDGTAAGTVKVADTRPQELTEFDGELFFAGTGADGVELWRSDGTPAGTERIKDINPGTGNSNPGELTVSGGTLFFEAWDSPVHDNELWKSDGTEAGTVLVEDIRPGAYSPSGPRSLFDLDGTLFFSADDGPHGRELWKSDGTEAGTVLIKDIRHLIVGDSGLSLQTFASFDGELYFTAYEAAHGRELWNSDGTEAGTVLVKDITPGANGPGPVELTEAGDALYFTASDGAHGWELWETDGTEAGTVLAGDIAPGEESSDPKDLEALNGRLLFSANDGVGGEELWGLDLDSTSPTVEAESGLFFWVVGDKTGTLSLKGWVNPNGAPTSCSFEYGLDPALTTSVPCDQDPGAGFAPVAVSAEIEGVPVQPHSFDSFRLVATNDNGTEESDVMPIAFAHADGGCAFLGNCEKEVNGPGAGVTPPKDPPPSGPKPRAFALREAKVQDDMAILRIRCRGTERCGGELELRRRNRKGRRLTLASGPYDVAAQQTTTVKVELTPAGQRLLSKAESPLKAAVRGDLKPGIVELSP